MNVFPKNRRSRDFARLCFSIKKVSLTLLFIFPITTVDAQKPILLNPGEKCWTAKLENVHYLLDENSSMTFSELLTLEESQETMTPLQSFNFGNEKQTHWFRFQLKNETALDQFIVSLRKADMGTTTLYYQQNGEWIADKHQFPYVETNHIHGRRLVFKLHSEMLEAPIYLSVKDQTRLPIDLVFQIWEPDNYHKNILYDEIGLAFFYGVLMVMLFYNLFVYFSIKDVSYLYYSFFVLFNILGSLFITQHYMYLGDTSLVHYYSRTGIFGLYAMYATAFLLFGHVLEVSKRYSNAFQKVWYGTAIFCGGIALLCLITGSDFFVRGSSLTVYTIIPLHMYLLIDSTIKKVRIAKFYLVAYSCMFLAGVFYTLTNYGFFEHNFLLKYTPLIGASLESVIISFALADRITVLRKKQVAAQQLVIEKTKENNKIISQQNELLEEKVVQRTKDLKELSNYKEGLTHMIAHDLKNPLNIILHLAKKDRIDGDHLKELNQSGKMMLQMVTNMLDVQKYEELSMQLKPEDIPLTSVIANAKYQIELLLMARSIRFKTEVPEGLMVHADLEVIIRLFVNLFSNAIKYNKLGGKLLVKAQEAGDKVRIAVEDDGKGIHKDQLPYIFDKFWQIDAKQSGVAQSTGLGLTFCKMAIEAHGEEISATSEVGQGTTITFELPKAKVQSNMEAEEVKHIYTKGDLTPIIYHFSERDKRQILGKYEALLKLPIFKYGSIEKELSTIQNPSDELSRWMNEVLEASLDWDQEAYEKLCNVLAQSHQNEDV